MTNDQIISEVKRIILAHAKPDRIYLFGSRANGEDTVTSDIDIAYYDENFKDNFIIEEKIRDIRTLLKIDVTNIAFTDERFKDRVISTGLVLYSATKKLRAEDSLYNFSMALEKYIYVVDREQRFFEDGYSDIYLDLIVKRFEFTYEMSWKALKRYLGFLGIEVNNPRMTIKEGFAQNIIDDENIWLDMIEQRNLSSHIYNEYQIKDILTKKDKFKEAFSKLMNNIESGLNISE